MKTRSKDEVKQMKLRHAKLAWQIIGCKFLYYEGAKYGLPAKAIVKDSYYDSLEEEYKRLSKLLGLKPTATNMVGFDSKKPSCKLVMEHLIATNGKCPIAVGDLRLSNKENPIQEARKQVNVMRRELKRILENVGVKEAVAKKIRIQFKKAFEV